MSPDRIIIDKLNVLRQSVIAKRLTSARGKNSRVTELSALNVIINMEKVPMRIHLKANIVFLWKKKTSGKTIEPIYKLRSV
jgi:hypothetical protein